MLKNELIADAYFKWNEKDGAEVYQDSEYKKLDSVYEKLYHELKTLLPNDKVKLLNDFCNINTDILAYESERCYTHGFKDGAELIIAIKG